MLELALNLIILIISALAAVIVVLVHEGAKYYCSLIMMHPIHQNQKSSKISILKWIDPIGLILFVFGNAGWQKPKEYNPAQFKTKERAYIPIVLSGYAANIVLIAFAIPLFRVLYNMTDAGTQIQNLIYYDAAMFALRLIQFSFSLMIVNLLPVPPLDMSKIIYALNPSAYFKLTQNERMIQAVFILLLAFNVVTQFVYVLFYPLREWLLR